MRETPPMIRFGNSPLVNQLEALSAVLFAIGSIFSILGRLKPNSIRIWPFLPPDAPFDVRLRRGRVILAVAIVILSIFAAYNLSQSAPYIRHLLSKS